ncbi:MAG: DUF2914 domain-containing protein [Elusimicrobia bacterium]|nr:DUF2914 domain-containing protein [Elusimicrobiota bacterium]
MTPPEQGQPPGAGHAPAAAPAPLRERAKRFYLEHEPACTAGFFVAGFLFDTLAVGRIDRLHNIIHQATYLFLCALFISLELRELYAGFVPPPRLSAAWRYHKGATHFMLGTLLNIYTLFYFKSASWGVSLVFLTVLAALLAVNERRPSGRSGATMRMGLFSLCLISYFTYLVPMLAGSIGALPFAGSLAAAGAVMGVLAWRLRRHLAAEPLRRHALVPFAAVQLGFAGLYAAKMIPPVPLSVSSIGIYHDVRRDGDRFLLAMTRPRWRFWERGDQTFLARPGDKVHCFVSVFSPTRFKERLRLRWFSWGPAGWLESDAVALDIVGGRDGGFRTYAVKSRYKPGRWRVRVETSDGRELGRIDFTLAADDSVGARPTRTALR